MRTNDAKIVRSSSLRGRLTCCCRPTYGKRERATEGGENGAKKSEPSRELLSFKFRPSRGVRSAFHLCQITI